MAEKIDAAGAFALLERVVAERGADYTYVSPDETTCLYVHGSGEDAAPGCGVALAATLAGVSLDTLASWDAEEPPTIVYVGRELFTDDALRVLQAFQTQQDVAETYAFALAKAGAALARRVE